MLLQHLLHHRVDVDARTGKNESAGHIALKHAHVKVLT